MSSKLVGKLALFMCVLLGLATAGSYLLIIDASGSMDDYLEGSSMTRLEAAQQAAINFVDASQGSDFAVMSFHDCNDGGDPLTGTIRVIQPLTSDKSELRSTINGIETGGYTPIAEAIAEGREYIQDNWQGTAKIILLTDGEENCGGDPVAEAEETYEDGIAVIDVISYAMGDSYDDELALEMHEEIAAAGGGNYYTADDEEELEEAFREIERSDSSDICCLPAFILPLLLVGLYVRRRG